MTAEQITLLATLGALNWAQTWHRPDGDPPAALAQRPPKVLVTKVGLDGHDRGSRLVEALPKNDTGKVLKTELRGWAETPEPD